MYIPLEKLYMIRLGPLGYIVKGSNHIKKTPRVLINKIEYHYLFSHLIYYVYFFDVTIFAIFYC